MDMEPHLWNVMKLEALRLAPNIKRTFALPAKTNFKLVLLNRSTGMHEGDPKAYTSDPKLLAPKYREETLRYLAGVVKKHAGSIDKIGADIEVTPERAAAKKEDYKRRIQDRIDEIKELGKLPLDHWEKEVAELQKLHAGSRSVDTEKMHEPGTAASSRFMFAPETVKDLKSSLKGHWPDEYTDKLVNYLEDPNAMSGDSDFPSEVANAIEDLPQELQEKIRDAVSGSEMEDYYY
jgi:hypothetical protein